VISHRPIRFVILGHGRTGSNLLGASLAQHPHATVRGELFHDLEEKRAAWPVEGRYLRTGEDPAAFVEEVAFAPPASEEALAVGFRLFYWHSRQDDTALRLWDRLGADRSVRIVHLVRHNLFESYVSRQVAGRTGEWLRRNESQAAPQPDAFELSAAKCRLYFDDIVRRREWSRSFFSEHPFLEISYEEVVADYQATLDRTFRFVGVPPVPVTAPYRKQASRSPREQIGNYEALREAFRGTPYETFFDA
jgi:LPS sulfotransferase NodH